MSIYLCTFILSIHHLSIMFLFLCESSIMYMSSICLFCGLYLMLVLPRNAPILAQRLVFLLIPDLMNNLNYHIHYPKTATLRTSDVYTIQRRVGNTGMN